MNRITSSSNAQTKKFPQSQPQPPEKNEKKTEKGEISGEPFERFQYKKLWKQQL